jgi:uncharacterized membrane protein (UPF0127 family)
MAFFARRDFIQLHGRDRDVMRVDRRHLRLRSERFFLALVIGAMLMVNSAAADICGYPEKGTLVVSRNEQIVATFRVGLAEKRDQHRKGLMGCHDLPPGAGLLFIYPDANRRVFWMKDTPLELAIIFISSGSQIMAVEKGHPYSTRHIRSPDKIQYVLEIRPDEGDAIRIGDRITLQLIPE